MRVWGGASAASGFVVVVVLQRPPLVLMRQGKGKWNTLLADSWRGGFVLVWGRGSKAVRHRLGRTRMGYGLFL